MDFYNSYSFISHFTSLYDPYPLKAFDWCCERKISGILIFSWLLSATYCQTPTANDTLELQMLVPNSANRQVTASLPLQPTRRIYHLLPCSLDTYKHNFCSVLPCPIVTANSLCISLSWDCWIQTMVDLWDDLLEKTIICRVFEIFLWCFRHWAKCGGVREGKLSSGGIVRKDVKGNWDSFSKFYLLNHNFRSVSECQGSRTEHKRGHRSAGLTCTISHTTAKPTNHWGTRVLNKMVHSPSALLRWDLETKRHNYSIHAFIILL